MINIQDLLQEQEDKRNKKDVLAQNKILSKEVKNLQDKLEYYEKAGINPKPIRPSLSKSKREATVLSLFSDYHCEERINKQSTNGINEYNLDIAKQRAENYFVNLLKRVEKHRRDINIDCLVIGMLGDLMHGFIHEEYLPSNFLTPIEATLFAQEQVERGLRYLLDNGKFKRIIIVCKVGNHSRTSLKPYSDNEALMSYEYWLYKQLEKRFPEIEFIIENNYISYYKVYNYTIAFSHGHAIKYAGGIGGLYVPLVKYITKQNNVIPFDLHCMGHFHTRIHMKKCLVNGCLNGYNSYAAKFVFEPEIPSQQFLLIDKDYSFTTNEPIFL